MNPSVELQEINLSPGKILDHGIQKNCLIHVQQYVVWTANNIFKSLSYTLPFLQYMYLKQENCITHTNPSALSIENKLLVNSSRAQYMVSKRNCNIDRAEQVVATGLGQNKTSLPRGAPISLICLCRNIVFDIERSIIV